MVNPKEGSATFNTAHTQENVEFKLPGMSYETLKEVTSEFKEGDWIVVTLTSGVAFTTAQFESFVRVGNSGLLSFRVKTGRKKYEHFGFKNDEIAAVGKPGGSRR